MGRDREKFCEAALNIALFVNGYESSVYLAVGGLSIEVLYN